MSAHPIDAVHEFRTVRDYVLPVRFDDDAEQTLDLEPILEGELFGPLRDLRVFRSVRVDPEAAP